MGNRLRLEMAESTRKVIWAVRVVVVELGPCYLDVREVVVKSCMVEGPFGELGGEEWVQKVNKAVNMDQSEIADISAWRLIEQRPA